MMETSTQDQKFCKTCGNWKDRSLFHNWKLGKDGKQTRCKACMLKYCEAHHDRIIANSRAYRARNLEAVRAYSREYDRKRRAEEKAAREAAH